MQKIPSNRYTRFSTSWIKDRISDIEYRIEKDKEMCLDCAIEHHKDLGELLAELIRREEPVSWDDIDIRKFFENEN